MNKQTPHLLKSHIGTGIGVGVASGGTIGIRYVFIPDDVPAKMMNDFFEDYEEAADYFWFDL